MLFEIGSNRSCSDNIKVLNDNGKIGLSRLENNKIINICKCEYDTIDIINNNFFLSNNDTILCYNSIINRSDYYNEVVLDIPYMYACDKEYQYVINMETGKIIYKKKLNKYNKSSYVCIGNTSKGHIFYDTKYSTYLYPNNDGYSFYNLPVSYSIIVNDDNIVNIVEDENGVGVIDSFGNTIIENNYDKIQFEINITAVNKNEEIIKKLLLEKCLYYTHNN